MRHPGFIITVLVFVLSQQMLLAQDVMKGVVVEEDKKGNLRPLIGANVYWEGTTKGASTDTNGVFRVDYKPEYRNLIISYIGYQTDTVLIEHPQMLSIILKSSAMLNEVKVVYKKKTTEVSFMDPIKTEIMGEKELFKAACCNLSESFETNPSIDVSFTDAITGTRQIQMLGLAGSYTQISQENIPAVRGLAAIYGLSYIPGAWMSSIQVTKGMGPVINGFESMAGQINVELKKPDDEEKLFLNFYINEGGRMEINSTFNQRVGPKWSTTLLMHAKNQSFKMDRNGDSFIDNPIGNNLILMNRWKFDNQKGLRVRFGLKGLYYDNNGGQMDYVRERDQFTTNYYGLKIETNRYEAFFKSGYVFPNNKYKSIGLQLSGSYHDQNSHFGLRRYTGNQKSFYSNLIYQSIIGNTNNVFKTGVSFVYDDYLETLDSTDYKRIESTPGAFFEYTSRGLENFTMVLGLRADYHNNYGAFVTPRVHMRYALTETTVIRASAGRGLKTANIFSENIGVLASSRNIIIDGDANKPGFGLRPEIAWNYGINVTQDFKLDYRDGSIGVDFYRTDFQNQIVLDLDQNTQEAWYYNLDGVSYSNSFQATINYELMRKLDLRIAYRWFEVKTTYNNQLLSKPLIGQNRAFLNLAYETGNTWIFDITFQWQGQKRIPNTATNPEDYRLDSHSPDYFVLNAQITKKFKNGIDIYLGMENITDYKQNNPILASDQPFGPYFDSSLIWGPIFGRMTYFGLRYKLKKKSKK
ncbi:MAG TPA: TonB-dependent receptor [Flavobacteriales bacterium]|nr:TonB-dependent receptor [Flavobacteriales bacterium]